MPDMRLKRNKDLLEWVKDRHKVMTQSDKRNRQEALEDIIFVNIPGGQWEQNMVEERGTRPCYEYNKTKIRCKRVINDIRDNRPSGKVVAVEGGDTEVAEINEGLIRNIFNASHADNAMDYAAEYVVEGGMGAWRINTAFSSDTAFDQDIVIEGIENPFNLYVDNHAKDFMKRDARDWIYTDRISHIEYEEKFGKAAKVDFEGDQDFDKEDDDWIDEETVRIVEYWFKKKIKKELWLFKTSDPKDPQLIKTIVVDSLSDEAAALKKNGVKPDRIREIDTHKIQMVVASGEKILEGPVDWAGSQFPFVMVHGEYKVIDGKKHWWGLVRNAKDAQRNYNVSKTAIAESIHSANKAKVWMTPKQAEGLQDLIAEAHKKNYPIAYYNPDPKAPGPPNRVGAADIPIALMQQSAIDDADLKDVMGVPDAAVGVPSGETSGRAIFARQQQGEIANFNYKDNMAKGVELTYEILLDLIPVVYDTERELRILGSDGVSDYKQVNQVVFDQDTGKSVRINDLASGRYDVTVTVGPAFATLRQEAVEIYGNLGQQFPQLMAVAGDLIFKSMDLPYADDISERIRAILPPEVQQTLDQDKEIPPEVQQAMQQAQQAMQQVQQHGQLVQEAAQELEGEKALNEKQKAEIKTELANVKTATAEFDKHVAETMLKLLESKTGLVTKEADIKVKGAELKEAVAEFGQRAMSDTVDAVGATRAIDEVLAQFMVSVDQAMAGIEAKSQEIEAKTDRKVVGGVTSRDGGKLTATVDFDDGTTKSVSAVRDGGNLRIVPPDGGDESPAES